MTSVDTSPQTLLPAAYQGIRGHLTELLATPPRPGVMVPHCPEWRVEDVVGHLVEVCARVRARESGAEAPETLPTRIPALLRVWEELSPPVDEFLAHEWTVDRGKLVMDAFTHELDIRDALRAPLPPPEHPALQVATTVVMMGLGMSLRGHGMGALRFETELGQWTAGEGAPVMTATGAWIDVYLSACGRRTPADIASRLRWTDDIRPLLPAFSWGPFTVPAD